MHHQAGTTRDLKAVLANPYGLITNNSYSSPGQHLGASGWPLTNAQGYTFSSTYRPGNRHHRTQPHLQEIGLDHNPMPRSRPSHQHTPSRQWYQSGNVRCTYNGCRFTGSHKSVEIHNMDRHLIYPAGWEHRRREGDWDADPSLKGCVMTAPKLFHCPFNCFVFNQKSCTDSRY
jgi:hypothetical protein